MNPKTDGSKMQPQNDGKEKFYALPESLRNSLAEYLASRPYREVAEGMQALAALQPIEVTSPEKGND